MIESNIRVTRITQIKKLLIVEQVLHINTIRNIREQYGACEYWCEGVKLGYRVKMCFSHTADEAKFEDKAESKDINGNFLYCYFIFFFCIFLGMFLPT